MQNPIIQCGSFRVTLIRKAIKNLYLRVLPPDGRIQVSAPLGAKNDEVCRLVLDKQDWILTQQKRVATQWPQAQRAYQTGEIFYLWGSPLRLEVQIADGRPSVTRQDGVVVLRAPRGADTEKRRRMIDQWYRSELKSTMPIVLAYCETVTGLRCAEWHIKNMKTRWGTCNPAKRRIWINLQLAQKPQECLVYVVMHELVHFLESGHGPRFKGFMDQFYPAWRAVRKLLNGTQPSA